VVIAEIVTEESDALIDIDPTELSPGDYTPEKEKDHSGISETNEPEES
jgi:hypothetical protein